MNMINVSKMFKMKYNYTINLSDFIAKNQLGLVPIPALKHYDHSPQNLSFSFMFILASAICTYWKAEPFLTLMFLPVLQKIVSSPLATVH